MLLEILLPVLHFLYCIHFYSNKKHVAGNLFLLFEIIALEQVGTQDTLPREHVSKLAPLTRDHIARKAGRHVRHVSTRARRNAREHVSTQDTV